MLARAPRISIDDVSDYLWLRIASEPVEILYALYFNAQSELLWDGEVARGTIDSVSVAPVEFARLAYEHSASVVIIAHNHPRGNARASEADLTMTKRIADAMRGFGLRLHDHLILTANEVVSLRAQGVL